MGGIVDESGFAKEGDQSAGVDRQYNGRLGEREDCQVVVFLVGVTPGGSALLDRVGYHIHRNKIARRPHTKTWMARHEQVKLLPPWN